MERVNRGNSRESENNEELMKKQVSSMLYELDKSEMREQQRKNKKTMFLIIGIIIEFLVIISIIKVRNKKGEYGIKVKCTGAITEKEEQTIKEIHYYYFNRSKKVSKVENDTTYIYSTKEDYTTAKNEIKNKKIYDFRGKEEKYIYDDKNYLLQHQIIYTYSELKKNRRVKFRNDIFKFNLPGEKKETAIKILDYDTVLDINNRNGYICE